MSKGKIVKKILITIGVILVLLIVGSIVWVTGLNNTVEAFAIPNEDINIGRVMYEISNQIDPNGRTQLILKKNEVEAVTYALFKSAVGERGYRVDGITIDEMTFSTTNEYLIAKVQVKLPDDFMVWKINAGGTYNAQITLKPYKNSVGYIAIKPVAMKIGSSPIPVKPVMDILTKELGSQLDIEKGYIKLAPIEFQEDSYKIKITKAFVETGKLVLFIQVEDKSSK